MTFMSFLRFQRLILRSQFLLRQTAEIDVRVPVSVTQFDLSESTGYPLDDCRDVHQYLAYEIITNLHRRLDFICDRIFSRIFASVQNRKKYKYKRFHWLYSDYRRDEFSQTFLNHNNFSVNVSWHFLKYF